MNKNLKRAAIVILCCVFNINTLCQAKENKPADIVIQNLAGKLDYNLPVCSFSPFYSDIGLGFDENGGIAKLYLHYNRKTGAIGNPFLDIRKKPQKTKNNVLNVKQIFTNDNSSANYVFYDRNSWIAVCTNPGKVSFGFGADPNITEARVDYDKKHNVFLFEGYIPKTDERDPDAFFPIIIGLKVLCGYVESGDGIKSPFDFMPDATGKLVLAFSVNLLDVEKEKILTNLANAPDKVDVAMQKGYQWLTRSLDKINLCSSDKTEAKALSMAAYTLLFNSYLGPGNFAGRVAQPPNRGQYATHYLWDSCFQTLGLEQMEPSLAKDTFLVLTDNLRVDGKMAQFLCSTWMRPDETQPPMVGWFGLRLVKKRNDIDLARKLLRPLLKNTRWWLMQRMTRYGLVGTWHGVEVWDNTPRLDKGPIVACDVNTYLLIQMMACAEFAEMLGEKKIATESKAMADNYAKKIIDVLYDPNDNIFKEVLIATGEKLKLKTPANFIPLLGPIPISREKASQMIKKYLLDKNKFYGDIPFPCVAYDEDSYLCNGWWRGPTWVNVAYLMLEVLKKHGFTKEYREAGGRIYNMIKADGKMSETFDSQTGEGLGVQQYGWTSAVFLQLHEQMRIHREN